MAYLQNMSGPVSSSRVIKHSVWTTIQRDYNVTSTTVIVTGNGIDFTTTAETTVLWIHVTGTLMGYDPDGMVPTSYIQFYHHSSSTATGAAPSGSAIGVTYSLGMMSQAGSTARHDLYANYSMLAKTGVSASTNYKIQLCAWRGGSAYYTNINGTLQGWVMESK